jgi:hypothetical protein
MFRTVLLYKSTRHSVGPKFDESVAHFATSLVRSLFAVYHTGTAMHRPVCVHACLIVGTMAGARSLGPRLQIMRASAARFGMHPSCST